MNLAEFRSITLTVIQDNGIAAYIPTLIIPTEGIVMAFEGIPDDMSHEEASRQWIRDSGYESKEYFLAFKVSDEEIHLEHHKSDSSVETAVIP